MKCMEHTWTYSPMNELFDRCRWCGVTRASTTNPPSRPLGTTGGSGQAPEREDVYEATSGPDDTLTIEANTWLQMCGHCDAGLPMGCTCPTGDYLSLIHRLDMARVALTDERDAARRMLAESAAEVERLMAGREIERTMIRNAVEQLAAKDATIERLWAQCDAAWNVPDQCAHPEDTGTAYDDRPRVTP